MKTASALLMMFLVGAAAGYLVFRLNINPANENLRSVVRRDTIIKLVESQPIVIEKHVAQLVYKRDTIIQTLPFTAIMDTVVSRDSIRAAYDFPENTFSMRFSRAVDSLAVEQVQVIDYMEDENRWWRVPTYVLAGVILGYLIGNK